MPDSKFLLPVGTWVNLILRRSRHAQPMVRIVVDTHPKQCLLSRRTLTGGEKERKRERELCDSFIFIDERKEEINRRAREFVELASFSFLKPFEYFVWFGKWLSRRRRRWRGRGAKAPRGICRPRRRWPATWAPPRAPTRSWRSSRSPHASFAWPPLCLNLRF